MTPWIYSPWNSPGQNPGSLFQGIFLTQGSTQGFPNCRQILQQLSHQESPRTLEWAAYPFSGGSSWARNQTGVSCTAGGFFANWATRGALYVYIKWFLMGRLVILETSLVIIPKSCGRVLLEFRGHATKDLPGSGEHPFSAQTSLPLPHNKELSSLKHQCAEAENPCPRAK